MLLDMKEVKIQNLKGKDKKIGIITYPIYKSGIQPLSNLLEIIDSNSSGMVYLITGNEGYTAFKENKKYHVDGIHHKKGKSILTKFLKHISIQLKISYYVFLNRSYVDEWIFFFGGGSLIIPLLTAKVLRRRTSLLFADCGAGLAKISKNALYLALNILYHVTYSLMDKLIVYSPGLIDDWKLNRYKNKIFIAHEHFLNFEMFTEITPLSSRKNTIGYIGRLNYEKGVENFVHSLPGVFSNQKDLSVIIGGTGELDTEIKSYFDEMDVSGRAKCVGWISHEELPVYLNKLQLLVIPSFTEGIPNIMLEAMACGTPVLATPVGAIKDMIIDGDNGFIMENNSPECIARNILRVLNSSNLREISENARLFVEENFTFERTSQDWDDILKK